MKQLSLKYWKNEEIIEPTPIDDIKPVYADMKLELEAKVGREVLEEEVLSYILFPQHAIIDQSKEVESDTVIEFEIFDGEVVNG